MFGPATSVQRLGSQRRAALVLADLLRDAARCELPCLYWFLGDSDVLTGQCLDVHVEDRRKTFVGWAEFLQIGDWAARDHDGLTTMTGFTSVRGVRVSITATLFPAGDAVAGGAVGRNRRPKVGDRS